MSVGAKCGTDRPADRAQAAIDGTASGGVTGVPLTSAKCGTKRTSRESALSDLTNKVGDTALASHYIQPCPVFMQ